MSRKRLGRLRDKESRISLHSVNIFQKVQHGGTAEDRLKILRRFSAEVWVLVLDKLKDPQDLTAMSNSSPYFRNILLSKRTLFLFPQVWNILGKKFESSTDAAYQEVVETPGTSCSASDNFGPIMRSFSGILKLRQACKTWCNSIDNFYQNLDVHFRMAKDSKKPLVQCKTGICGNESHQFGCWTRIYTFWGSAGLTEFANHFRGTHANKKNPFLSNAVDLTFCELEDFRDAINNFLAIYGKYIWHCYIPLPHFDRPLLSTYAVLKKCLAKMPNLKSLRISYMGGSIMNTREFNVLNTQISHGPLPFLQHLKFLETTNLPAVIFNELLHKSSNLNSIEIRGYCQQSFYNIFSQKYLNISEISLQIYQVADFNQLYNVDWKLSKIYLDFSNISSYLPWSRIFHLLQHKWRNTATEVALHLPRSRTASDVFKHIKEHARLRLNLPHVHRLSIVLGNFSSIDFILPMKNQLKQLDVFEYFDDMNRKQLLMLENREFDKTVTNKVLKYRGMLCGNQMNVWEKLPKLQYFEYIDKDEWSF